MKFLVFCLGLVSQVQAAWDDCGCGCGGQRRRRESSTARLCRLEAEMYRRQNLKSQEPQGVNVWVGGHSTNKQKSPKVMHKYFVHTNADLYRQVKKKLGLTWDTTAFRLMKNTLDIIKDSHRKDDFDFDDEELILIRWRCMV